VVCVGNLVHDISWNVMTSRNDFCQGLL
jgi:hypothetical protein